MRGGGGGAVTEKERGRECVYASVSVVQVAIPVLIPILIIEIE